MNKTDTNLDFDVLHESGQDYLERILMLKEKNGQVISLDVANSMGYSKASVSRAVKKLKEMNYITVGEKGLIELTDSGYKIAQSVLERHRLFTEYFIKIGVPEDIAEKDACSIEHVLTDVTYMALLKHLNKDKK